ncbi:RNA polymerase sigma factor [Spiribacter halobius]|uniref:RNA polymerase sigma factor n=1 Tax=Sediminicurvatus halobius TaxID=2182432 RepID=A0A2U2MXG9_9GAMM|nr:RNA polymerase sigma factor [Spiribacter halobius]PWG61570.1 RNA polymerase sigma factor [Spiribacter halobius]UEX77138.1 RNA polymerase sigma factor [Spiribacter halobius]
MATAREWLVCWMRPLFAYAMTLTRDRERAQDLVQECAARALAAERLPAAERARGRWLFRTLRHCHVDGVRAERRRREAEPSVARAAAGWALGQGAAPEEEIALRQALRRLPPAQYEVILLVDLQGYGYREAAATLALPVGTVMSRLARARRALLGALEPGVLSQGGDRE